MCFLRSSTSYQQFGKPLCKYLPLLIIFLLSILLISPSHCLARTDRKAEKKRIEKGINKYRINISKLQEGIASQRLQIESSEDKQRNLLDEIEHINTRLLAQLKKLAGFEEQVKDQEKLITAKEEELQVFQTAKQSVQDHLQKRIKAYYKMGEIGIANVAFSTESMPQMLNFRDSFANLLDYDKSLITEYRSSISKLQQAKTVLSLEKGVLDDFIVIAKEERDASNAIKLEKEALFNQINTQKELHEQAVQEMKKVADNLKQSLKSLKKKGKLFNQGFLLDKGSHPAPIQGEVIARFGEERANKLGIKGKTTGITIASKGVNKVYAIFEGEVHYASYLYGYGNTIIIDHGFNYFSIISRLEKLLVNEGDKVEQSDIIALTGDTATLMDGGIYLEIRHGSKPLDPLQWIDKNDLTLP
jgi:septal ring factor EnvC (AmiA/AmiB activator)